MAIINQPQCAIMAVRLGSIEIDADKNIFLENFLEKQDSNMSI
jgi:hypothetical protein